jgi:hypothetical protein
VELDRAWPASQTWEQILRRPGQQTSVCFDGYLDMDFAEDDSYHRRYVRPHSRNSGVDRGGLVERNQGGKDDCRARDQS